MKNPTSILDTVVDGDQALLVKQGEHIKAEKQHNLKGATAAAHQAWPAMFVFERACSWAPIL